jgi:hypothetical protein
METARLPKSRTTEVVETALCLNPKIIDSMETALCLNPKIIDSMETARSPESQNHRQHGKDAFA